MSLSINAPKTALLARKLSSLSGRLENAITHHVRQKTLDQVARIIQSGRPPETSCAENDFYYLQAMHNGKKGYQYDRFSVWARAVSSAKVLIKRAGSERTNLDVLEAGCGDGVVSRVLKDYGHNPLLLDMEDWRHDPARNLPFVQGRLEEPIQHLKEKFDVIFSINTFEHVDDPKQCLDNLSDMLKVGGIINLVFNPLYASPWGMHAYRSISIPYPQFLLRKSFLSHKLDEIGIWDLGQKRSQLQPLNKWSVHSFRSLWQSSGMSIDHNMETRDLDELDIVCEYPECFQGRGLSCDDLTVSGIDIVLRKTH